MRCCGQIVLSPVSRPQEMGQVEREISQTPTVSTPMSRGSQPQDDRSRTESARAEGTIIGPEPKPAPQDRVAGE